MLLSHLFFFFSDFKHILQHIHPSSTALNPCGMNYRTLSYACGSELFWYVQEGETQYYAVGFNVMADQSKSLTFFVIKPAKCNVDKVTTGHVISGTL